MKYLRPTSLRFGRGSTVCGPQSERRPLEPKFRFRSWAAGSEESAFRRVTFEHDHDVRCHCGEEEPVDV